jgi:LuxR family maltose regulon positive regulatory protein
VTELGDGGLDLASAASASPGEYATRIAPALGRAVRRSTAPFVLVIDDVHRLTDLAATDLVSALIENIPDSSLLLLVGRTCHFDVVARLRSEAVLAELGESDLALDADGVGHVLASLGVSATAEHVDAVAAATEGWPVGVRLAGLASLADGQFPARELTVVSGRDAIIVDYLASEWLWGLSDDDRDFLMKVSVLDWLSGAICNEVLDRHDAGEVLRRISSDRRLVIPLDRRNDAYRMHGLLRDALTAQLERIDADAVRAVHRRASEWFEKTGDIDRAVRHALDADDEDRAQALVVHHTPSMYARGHHAIIQRWVDGFPREHVVGSPALCFCAALAALAARDESALSVWIDLGEQAVRRAPDSDPEARLCLLDLRSTTSTGPVRQVLADAAAAYEGLPPGIWHVAACLAYGVWS